MMTLAANERRPQDDRLRSTILVEKRAALRCGTAMRPASADEMERRALYANYYSKTILLVAMPFSTFIILTHTQNICCIIREFIYNTEAPPKTCSYFSESPASQSIPQLKPSFYLPTHAIQCPCRRPSCHNHRLCVLYYKYRSVQHIHTEHSTGYYTAW